VIAEGTVPPEPEKVGDRLGHYVLEELLGQGSMGRVWKAAHITLGRRAAIKILKGEHAANRVVINRFFDEARTVNRIGHDHIVEIFDFIEEHEPFRAWCVMEYLDGEPLSERLGRGPLALGETIELMRQLSSALAAAHALGVVHRDVKPENVFLLKREGGALEMKLLDFGVAKLAARLRSDPVTATAEGEVIGTPLYMAPEQIVGVEVDTHADVWAFGVLLYRLLAGRLPFDSPHFGQLSMDIIRKPTPPLPARTPCQERIPPALAALVHRCLSKRAEQRPLMVEVHRALWRDLSRSTHLRTVCACLAAGAVLGGSLGFAWPGSGTPVPAAPLAMAECLEVPASIAPRKMAAAPAPAKKLKKARRDDETINPFAP
jgi:serine/threonine-protein kinase